MLVLAEADPMRPIDILGTMGFILAGLFVVAFEPRVVSLIMRFSKHLPHRWPSWYWPKGEAAAHLGVIWLAGGTVVLGSLLLLKVLERRPGDYPGGAFTTTFAVLALAVLAFLLGRLGSRALAARRKRRVLP